MLRVALVDRGLTRDQAGELATAAQQLEQDRSALASMLALSYDYVHAHFETFMQVAREHGWRLHSSQLGPRDCRAEWTFSKHS